LNQRVPGGSSSYSFGSAMFVRLLRGGLVVGGLVLLLAIVAVGLLGAPAWLLLLAAVLLLAVPVGVVALRRVEVVRFDESGYRVRLVRGTGVRQAPWRDVEDAVAGTVAGSRCVTLRLRDGRSTVVPVELLAGPEDAFVLDLQRRLNRGHGYRPLPRSR
jgi:hypothetical protein